MSKCLIVLTFTEVENFSSGEQYEKRQHLESLEKDLNTEIKEKLKELRKELQLKAAKLSKYSVDDILKQGYTITRKNGKIVKRGIELSKNEIVEVQFKDARRKMKVD